MAPAVTERGASGGRSTHEVFVLAVDLGTGGPKVAVVSSAGRIAASASEPVGLRFLPGGGAE
jgi:xylulokinase